MKRGKCPFYGFRWPERRSELVDVGGHECGLDFDEQGACRIAAEGGEIDFQHCKTAARAKPFLSVIANRVRFVRLPSPDGMPFSAWSDLVMRRTS